MSLFTDDRSRAVFLDKDGTLIEDVPYNVDPDLMALTAGAVDGLLLLHVAGFKIVVISNQSGVARGYFRESDLHGVEIRLHEMLGDAGVLLDGFYYCPHLPGGTVPAYSVECDCRKPSPGMLFRAARDLDIDLSASWLVGDILNDVEAGRRAGCRTVLLDNGNETEWVLTPQRMPHHIAFDMAEAALIVASVGGITRRSRLSVAGSR